jgi:hypothetical protein
MSETPKSNLNKFTTDESDFLDELFEGVGEMTGLSDKDVNKLLEGVPYRSGPITVRNVLAQDPEKAKFYSVFLELSFPDGRIYTVGVTANGGTYFTGDAAGTWVTGGMATGMKFDPPKDAGSVAVPDTSDVDESWDDF